MTWGFFNSKFWNSTSTMSENNTEYCNIVDHFTWLLDYQVVYMWFIFVLGFVENLFVILVFMLHRSRCTVAEIYLGNLAAADLIFVSGLPFWAISISRKFTWPFGSFLCVAVNSLTMLNLYGSIYFLMMVSIDRYLALVKTMSFGRMRTPRWAKVNCVIIWIFAALVSLPKVIFRKVDFVQEVNATACHTDFPSDNWIIANNIILNLVGFVIPIIVIGFCTIQIIRALRDNTMQKFKERNNEKRATWLVLAVLLVFIICWLPFHISAFIDILDKCNVFAKCSIEGPNEVFNQISSYIGFSNSCLNPLLYVIVGNHFRKKVRDVFLQLTSRRYRERGPSMQTENSFYTTQTSYSLESQKKKSSIS